MFYRILIFFVLIFISQHLFAQGGVITGRVLDKNDRKGIEFTTLTLFHSADSSLAGGTVSDTSGTFTLSDISPGSYYLKANFIGYEALFISLPEIGPSNPSLELGEIELSTSGELGSVDIVTEKNVFEMKIDKKVFNADENLTSKGGSGLDLMRQIPTITVDENDNILLRGDANVTILIDGRPSSMPPNQFLRQIPASAIDKVEIITNPSAKYDPEGVSGIINIVLKKNKMSGFNGTLNTSFGYGIFPKSNSSVNLNYRNEHFNVFANYSYYYGRTWFGGTMDRDVLLADSTWDRLKTNDYGERINTYHSATVGMDYFANDKNTFYLTANLDYGSNQGSRLMNYNNTDENGELLYYSQRNGNINAPSKNYVFTGGWQKTFNRPDHTLFLDLNFSNLSFIGDEWLWHKYYDLADVNYQTRYQHTIDNTYNQTMLAKADYVWPITDSIIFEAGFHFTQRLADNDFFSESAAENEIYSNDTNLINRFSYLQSTFAPYVTLSRQFKKLGIKAGLRAEPTMTSAKLVNTSEVFNKNYVQLFPSIHLGYNLNDFTVIQLSYSRRINRPELDQLNPFTNYSDNLTLETGNPFLKPEIIHVNELGFMRYWQKFNLNATVYYRLINDLIRRQLFYDGIYTHITNGNLGSSSLSGGDLILTYMPVKGLRLVSSTSIWNTSTRDLQVTNGNWQNYTGMYTSLMASYRMKSGWSFQFWGSYAPKTKVIQGYILHNYGGGFALQKRFLKEKATLNLSIYDILKSRWFAFESNDLGNYTMSSYRRWESRSFYVTFTYNFGKLVDGKQRLQNSSGGIGDDKDIPLSN